MTSASAALMMLTMMTPWAVVNQVARSSIVVLPSRRSQAQEERRQPEVGEQPAGERHPLEDPDHEPGHDQREGDAATQHPALEDVVATRPG